MSSIEDIWPDGISQNSKLERAYCPKCKKNQEVYLYRHIDRVNYFVTTYACQYDTKNKTNNTCFLEAYSKTSNQDDVILCILTYRRMQKNG